MQLQTYSSNAWDQIDHNIIQITFLYCAFEKLLGIAYFIKRYTFLTYLSRLGVILMYFYTMSIVDLPIILLVQITSFCDDPNAFMNSCKTLNELRKDVFTVVYTIVNRRTVIMSFQVRTLLLMIPYEPLLLLKLIFDLNSGNILESCWIGVFEYAICRNIKCQDTFIKLLNAIPTSKIIDVLKFAIKISSVESFSMIFLILDSKNECWAREMYLVYATESNSVIIVQFLLGHIRDEQTIYLALEYACFSNENRDDVFLVLMSNMKNKSLAVAHLIEYCVEKKLHSSLLIKKLQLLGLIN